MRAPALVIGLALAGGALLCFGSAQARVEPKHAYWSDCFRVDLPSGFVADIREKPDPWKPWLGRWSFRRGQTELFVHCEPLADGRAGGLSARVAAELTRYAGGLKGLRRSQERRIDDEGQALWVAAGRGLSGGRPVLVTMLWKPLPPVRIVVGLVLRAPISALRRGVAQLLSRIAATLATLQPEDQARQEARLLGRTVPAQPAQAPAKSSPDRKR